MDFFAEAVYVLFKTKLDELIRENEVLWGDFCEHTPDGRGLNLQGRPDDYEADGTIKMSKKTIIPALEQHFGFSTRMMLFAVDQYMKETSQFF